MKFVSTKYRQLRVVLDPKSQMEIQGKRVTKGLYDLFPNGKTVEFNDGEYETKDKAIINALKSSSGYAVDFVTDEREADQPNDEALLKKNEKKEFANEIASVCPKCGAKYRKPIELEAHMKSVHSEG